MGDKNIIPVVVIMNDVYVLFNGCYWLVIADTDSAALYATSV